MQNCTLKWVGLTDITALAIRMLHTWFAEESAASYAKTNIWLRGVVMFVFKLVDDESKAWEEHDAYAPLTLTCCAEYVLWLWQD